ncbi:MAG TPA: hypothetical protein VEQ67_16755 [Mycobacterium sp.]|nr:hypothetical protein [Mycobacterium sp.]
MRRLMAYVAALGAVPFVAIAATQTVAPAFADTPGVSPTCFPQTMNPHPTDPAGQTTNTLFCTPTNPNGTGSGGSGSAGSSASGSAGRTGAGTTGAGTTAGGGQTSLASSSGSVPDESSRSTGQFTWSSDAGKPAASNNTGLFGGLVGFFASAGGLVFLFGLLMLMLIVLVALAVIAAVRRGAGKNFASRFSRVSYRA